MLSADWSPAFPAKNGKGYALYPRKHISINRILAGFDGIWLTTASPLFRRLFVTCDVFARYFFVAFPWLFRGFFVALICLEKQCLGVFRGYFVAFPWLFRGPHFGQILRVPWKSLLTFYGQPHSPRTDNCAAHCTVLLGHEAVFAEDVGVLLSQSDEQAHEAHKPQYFCRVPSVHCSCARSSEYQFPHTWM